MPELKHNFIKGRMNLDLDDRLVPDGEYREAMNIEVSTSEGSNVGTVQSALGNVIASNVVGAEHVVGSIANGKTDKIYYLISGNKKDMIAEHSVTSGSTPVLVDVYEIDVNPNPLIQTSTTGDYLVIPNTNTTNNIRVGMYLEVDLTIDPSVPFFGGGQLVLSETEGYILDAAGVLTNFGPVQVVNKVYVSATNTWEIYFKTKTGNAFIPALLLGQDIKFKSKKILNFTPNNFITGINIVDDLLFWTDNVSEPKKINITRSKEGTPNFDMHTKFVVYNADGVQLLPSVLDPNYMIETQATVVKKSPLTPPSLEIYNDISGRGVIFGVTDSVNFSEQTLDDPALGSSSTTTNVPFPPGTLVDIPGSWNVNAGDPDFQIGDVLILSSESDLVNNPRIFKDSEIRVVVISKTNSILTVKILSFKKGFFPYTVGGEDWAICLEQSKALFEFKFPRFAYRYKYQDSEYSCFSPFSEVAFIPGTFNYDSVNAYNLGMVNQLRFLKILDFVPDGLPKGVIEIDILYKESNSPNIYTVKTIKHGDPEWLTFGHVTPQSPWTGQAKGAIQLESEIIYAAVPSNQLLRPWDNVPRRAKAQELSANRIIYGNYVEGYDLNSSQNINLSTFIKSKDLSNELTEETPHMQGAPSIKSLRTYQVGIVYRDEFGRETPVFTNEKASFNIAKSLADDHNSLFVQNKSLVPDWVDSYKFFIKETSNEYYNLALDRWYDAEDGGVWLSFPSAERNKVDEETYLILKKQHDNSIFVEEEARYKVIAIENEAPDYIRLQRTTLNIQDEAGNTIIAATTNITSAGTGGPPIGGATAGKSGLVIRLFNATASTKWYPIKSINNGGVTDVVTLNGTFEVDVTTEIMGGVASGVSWEIAEEVYHNKPEFQGRFFVKIAEDGVLLGNIDTAPATADTFTVRQSAKQYYIKSTGFDNSWAQKQMWYNYANSWRETVNDPGPKFFIDEIRRDWGSVPGGVGPWSGDDGKGITGNRSGPMNNHIEFSLSEIRDNTKNGFSISSHNKTQRDFYKSMHTANKWIRWKEDPNGIIYEIKSSIGQGDSAYDHGAGILNYDGGKKKPRTWKSNKTRRLYIKLAATGWRIDDAGGGGTGDYKHDLTIQGADPSWIAGGVGNGLAPDTSAAAWVTTSWAPNKDTSGISIEQPVNNNDSGNMNNPTSLSNTNSSGTNVIGSGPSDMNCEVQTGTGFYNTIEIVEKYDADAIKEMSDNPAIFETEPKEDIGLDIYYEMDQAFPTEINELTNESFAKIGSSVQTDFPNAFIETWKDVGLSNGWTATVVSGSSTITLSNPNLANWDLIGASVSSGGLTTGVANNLIPGYFPNILGTTPVETRVESISSDQITLSQEATASGSNLPIVFTRKTLPKIKKWDDNILTLDCKVVGSCPPGQIYNTCNTAAGFSADNVNLPIGMGLNYDSLIFNRLGGGTITGGIYDLISSLAPTPMDGIDINANGFLTLKMRRDSSRAKIDLNWHNCYSFGNGVESDRVRDDYNAVRLDKGVKASTTLAIKYQEERKKNSLIYSGIYNNASGVNNTNQFIMAEKITKDLNPRHGSIQKLHAREGDLITLCEDKVFKILANKDALYNADGNPQMIATNRVLGQATPMGGEYGISTNPESFASQAYKAYFSDRSRGVILKLDGQGLVPISDHGMKDYFADNLVNASEIIGSYDDKKDSYNVTLTGVNETISYGERTNGWTSFKSFIQEGGVSLNNNYYTFKNGDIWRHHQGATASFYGVRTNPFVNVLFNQLPGSVKSFGSLNYEGSDAQVTQNFIDGEYNNNLSSLGWYVSEGNTNLQQTDLLEFKDKEGKFFSRMKGEAYDAANIDLSEFSFQGIDIASSIVENTVSGCTDASAANYDPLATSDCDGVVDGSEYRCCCYDYGCTDSLIGFYPATNGLDRFGSFCTFPCQNSIGEPIGFAADNFNPKFDCCPETGPCCNYPAHVYGCTDPLAVNYYSGANFDDGTCCYTGCIDPLADNYNLTACADDGSCTYSNSGPFNLTVSDMGDQDSLTDPNEYKVSVHNLGDFQTNSNVPNVAYLQIAPNPGFTVQASDFSISGAQPATILPPTFVGGTLPAKIEFVKFEDSDNKVYDDYTDPNGTNANPLHDPNWIATGNNTVVAIVALHPFLMPANDLLLQIDIDGYTTQSTPVVNNITLT